MKAAILDKYDKQGRIPTGRKKAKNSKWRIRETTLLGLAVLGGSIIIVQLALIVYFIISKTI